LHESINFMSGNPFKSVQNCFSYHICIKFWHTSYLAYRTCNAYVYCRLAVVGDIKLAFCCASSIILSACQYGKKPITITNMAKCNLSWPENINFYVQYFIFRRDLKQFVKGWRFWLLIKNNWLQLHVNELSAAVDTIKYLNFNIRNLRSKCYQRTLRKFVAFLRENTFICIILICALKILQGC